MTGPTGSRLAASVRAVRDGRGLNQPQLAALMEALGAPIHASAVSKIEQRERRVDVDDLIALAIALDTTPNRLLLPGTAGGSADAELTPEVRTPAVDAWKWAAGDEQLPIGALPADSQQAIRDDRDRAIFRRENRPHLRPEVNTGPSLQEHSDLMRSIEVIAQLARIRGVPLAEINRYLGYSYVVASDDQPTVVDYLPGARG